MHFAPVNLLYFVVATPVVLGVMAGLRRTVDPARWAEQNGLIVAGACLLLFIVRILLVAFQATIGVMPYIVDDVIFYGLLAVFGVGFTVGYVRWVERRPWDELGLARTRSAGWAKSLGAGLAGFLPLVALFPLLIALGGVQVSTAVTWEKVFLGITFGLVLGGFYEEVMFRGVVQARVGELAGHDAPKTVLLTATLFTVTHLGYLPFTGYGIFYLFLFVMALELSVLRLKFGLGACAVLHGGIVFVLVLFV